MTIHRLPSARPPSTWCRIPVLAALAAVAFAASAVAAAQPPFAVFDRLAWAPDGRSLVFQSTLMSNDFSPTDPLRVDTLLVEAETGKATCLSPRVEAFALNAAQDSVLFADAYGLYVMPFPGGAVRQIVWRRPASDLYIRRLAFAQDGRYLVNIGCFTELSIGCNEQWPVSTATDRTALADLRMLLPDGPQPRRAGYEPQYVRDYARRKTESPFDDPAHRAALLRGLVRSENLAPGKTPAPTVDVRFARALGDDRYWFATVAVHRKRPWLSRAYSLIYVPLLKEVRPIAPDVAAAFLPLAHDAFLYNTSDGLLWRVGLDAGQPVRSRVVTAAVPEWAHNLGPSVRLMAARAVGLDSPTKAEELASSLASAGYHAWPITDGRGGWAVSVGWYGARAEAESASAMLGAQGYRSEVREAQLLELRGTRGSRPARGARLPAPPGALAGSEAILEFSGADDYPACAVMMRRSGEEPRILLTGCTDEAPEPPRRTAQTPP